MSKEKISKTNAMRILDSHKIDYEITTYDASDGHIDGASVAEKVGKLPDEVFKTLVTSHGTGAGKEYFVFVIPVAKELDLKKAAKVANVKNIEMIPVKDINQVTGYIRGGCSPVGMKKLFKTFVHETAELLPHITFSGGKIGTQITTSPENLQKITNCIFTDLIK